MTDSPSGSDQNQSAAPLGPLVDGDCLSANEFLRRYLPHRQRLKAELINGLVSLNRGVRADLEDLSSSMIRSWMKSYALLTPGTRMEVDTMIVLAWDTVPQPNIVLRVLPENGGKSRMTDTEILTAAPELIVDFTTGHQTFDIRDRLGAFRRQGVVEYLIWWADGQKLDWYCLDRGKYSLNLPDSNGVLTSHSFPGLRLNLSALLNRNSAAVMTTLRRSLESPEHAAFLTRLERQISSGRTESA